jgi:4-hydroxymandelate oxidase
VFAGAAAFLADPAEQAKLDTYLSDLTRPYPPGAEGVPATLGHSYGEMAEALIAATAPADEPVDLLILAFSIHDMQPGRATATYLSHVCPGNPMSFAICDQGSAAAFSGLRIARDYSASAGPHRALLIVVEQSALPYDHGAARPEQHRGVAMMFRSDPAQEGSAQEESAQEGPGGGSGGGARLVALRQRPNLAPDEVAGRLGADLAEVSSGYHRTRVVASPALAAAWPGHPGDQVRVVPDGQPSTGPWWQLLDELDELSPGPGDGSGGADLLVAADYEPGLGILSLAAVEPG